MSKQTFGVDSVDWTPRLNIAGADPGHHFPEEGDTIISLPKGSMNSRDANRANLSEFLHLGGARPIGYSPDQPDLFPYLPGAEGLSFVVNRPQDAPEFISMGIIHAFFAFGDVAADAREAGLGGFELVTDIPFAKVDVVVAVRRECSSRTFAEFLTSTRAPIRCASELPYLARKAFREETAYRSRFGNMSPTVQLQGNATGQGVNAVRIFKMAGSSESPVRLGSHDCAVVVRSTGRTIEECQLRVLKVVGTYFPGLYCHTGLYEHPRHFRRFRWFQRRVELARVRWEELQRRRQLELPFQAPWRRRNLPDLTVPVGREGSAVKGQMRSLA